MEIGNKIKELRMEQTLSQDILAKKSNISRSVLSQYENNLVEPTASVVARLANALNVSTDYLLGLTDDIGFSPAENAAGLSSGREEYITAEEEKLLEAFRKIGQKHGAETQRALIEVAKSMI